MFGNRLRNNRSYKHSPDTDTDTDTDTDIDLAKRFFLAITFI